MSESPNNLTLEKGWKSAFLASLASLPNVSKAARTSGISRCYAYQARDADPEFAQQWDDVIEESTDDLEDTARGMANGGDTTMVIFLLKAHRPEKYREKVSTEHSGRIEHEIVIVHENQNPDQPTYPPLGAGGLAVK